MTERTLDVSMQKYEAMNQRDLCFEVGCLVSGLVTLEGGGALPTAVSEPLIAMLCAMTNRLFPDETEAA